jgi:hypothetical protein
MTATALLDLAKAGFTDEQVRALAAYFDSQMATKANITELKGDLAEVKAELKYDIEKLRVELTAELARVRADLELKIAGLDLKIADSKVEIIKWVIGVMIAQGAAIVALIKLLPGAHL